MPARVDLNVLWENDKSRRFPSLSVECRMAKLRAVGDTGPVLDGRRPRRVGEYERVAAYSAPTRLGSALKITV